MTFSFIERFRSFCAEFTDAPDQYLRFAAVSMISTSLGSRAVFASGDANIYPNTWIVLIGSSSSARKSTCISIAMRMMEDACPGRVIPSSITTEALFEALQQSPDGCMYHSEFLAFLDGLKKEYNSGLKAALTDFYDVPAERRRKTMSNNYKIRKPCISMFGGTTVEWFLDKADDEDFAGGFLPRFLLVPPGTKTRSLALPPPADKEKRSWCVSWLRGLSRIDPVRLSLRAKDRYEEWYQGLLRDIASGASNYEAYGHRLATYVLKLSMIYHFDTLRMDRGCRVPDVIEEATLRRAIGDGIYLFTVGNRLFMDESGSSDWLIRRKTVLRALRSAGLQGATRGELLDRTRMRPRELDEVVDALKASGRIGESEAQLDAMVLIGEVDFLKDEDQ